MQSQAPFSNMGRGFTRNLHSQGRSSAVILTPPYPPVPTGPFRRGFFSAFAPLPATAPCVPRPSIRGKLACRCLFPFCLCASRMLEVLSLPHLGRHHCGIDDCRNLARIAEKLLSHGVCLKATSNCSSPRTRSLPSPTRGSQTAAKPAAQGGARSNSSVSLSGDSAAKRKTSSSGSTRSRQQRVARKRRAARSRALANAT